MLLDKVKQSSQKSEVRKIIRGICPVGTLVQSVNYPQNQCSKLALAAIPLSYL